MQSLDADLNLLRDELERLDYVVVQNGDHICVRLPLVSSVRIRHADGRFRFVSRNSKYKRFQQSGCGTALPIEYPRTNRPRAN